MIKVAERKKIKGADKYVLRVYQVPESSLELDEEKGRYVITSKEEVSVLAEAKVDGKANSDLRMKRMCGMYNAASLTDIDAVKDLMGPPDDEEFEPVRQDEQDSVVDLDETHGSLLAVGYSHADLDRMSHDTKLALVGNGLLPSEVRLKSDGSYVKLRTKRRPSRTQGDPGVRGHRVHVRRSSWKPGAKFEIGTARRRADVDRVAQLWQAAGFDVEVIDMPQHHRAKEVPNTLRDEPFEPIVCAHVDCNWVGEALASHIKVHGISMQDYQKMYRYDGPTLVGAGADSVNRAHAVEAERRSIRQGMLIVRVKGDKSASVWRVERIHNANEYEIVFVSGNDLVEDSDRQSISAKELLNQYHPLGMWTRAVRRRIMDKAKQLQVGESEE